MEKKLDVKLSGDDTCAVSAHWSSEEGGGREGGREGGAEEGLVAEWALKARLQPFPQTTGDAAASVFLLFFFFEGLLRWH